MVSIRQHKASAATLIDSPKGPNDMRRFPDRRLDQARVFFACALFLLVTAFFSWSNSAVSQARHALMAFLQTTRTGKISASPNPIVVCDGSGQGTTKLTWSASGATSLEVHIGSPTGTLFAQSGFSGSKTTDNTVTNGTVFYLQDVSGGLPLTAANTLATVTVTVTSSGCTTPPPPPPPPPPTTP